MKPLGMIGLAVIKPSRVEDRIWDSVEEAILAGWSPEQFKREAAQAWSQILRDQAKRAAADLIK